MPTKFTKGQRVLIKPEWRDDGDDAIDWVCVSDEQKGRVDISPNLANFSIKPIQTVTVDMIEAAM